MNNPNNLTRVCTSCGLTKPLSAFLQISGTQGTSYGSICSDCRRIVIPNIKQLESEEKSSSSSSLRIGSQQKIASDIEKLRQYKDLKDSYEHDAKERDQETEKDLEKSEIKNKAEKDHRKFYIDAKKQGFLSVPQKKTSQTQIEKNTQQFNTLEESTRQAENQQVEETKKAEASLEHQNTSLMIDLTTPFADPQFSDSRFTLGLKKTSWFKTGAPLDRNLIKKSFEQLHHKVLSNQKKHIYDKKNQHNEKEKKDALFEEINKLKEPSKKRGR